ncbi:MAG: hypothetical protein MUD14_20730 [Hydrococcus sp. Prado102]|jgi:hypothetical protein|nr:hypothetical protein [Hydrococcus sp. Prado102]
MFDSDRIVIRPACFEDAESIARLCTQLGYRAARSQIEQRLHTLNSNEHHVIYVATLPIFYQKIGYTIAKQSLVFFKSLPARSRK